MENIVLYGQAADTQETLMIPLSLNQLKYGKIWQIGKDIGGITVSRLFLGHSAFPFKPWLMKPFTSAVLTPIQSNFNYRLSRACMVVECAYGQHKGRWRILLCKCESTPVELRSACLACIVLIPTQMRWETGQLLEGCWTKCYRIPDTNHKAIRIRNSLVEKLWSEKQGHGVSYLS